MTNRNIKELLDKNCLMNHEYFHGTVRDFTKNGNDAAFGTPYPRWRKYQNGLLGLGYDTAEDDLYATPVAVPTQFSIECLLFANSVGLNSDFGRILESYTGSSVSFRFNLVGGVSSFRFDCGVALNTDHLEFPNVFHAVAVRDDSSDGIIYVNGKNRADAAVGSNTGGSIYIGNRTTGSRAMDGALFMLRIFNTELSPHEVQGLFQESRRIVSPTKRTHFHYKADDVAVPGEKGLQIAYNMKRNGNVVVDVSGNGVDGTLNGPPSDHRDKVLGSCLKFDGIKDEVSVDLSSFDPQQGTLSFWFKLLKPVAGESRMLLASASAGNFLYVYVDTSQNLFTRFGQATAQDSGFNVTTNKWAHISVSWTPTHVYAYIDGNLTDDYATTFDSNPTIGHIGANFNASGAFINTLVSGWKWHDELRTPQEIKNEYQKYSKRLQYKFTLEDANVSPAVEGGTIGDTLINTPFRFADAAGTWRIVDDEIEGRKVKAIKNIANGALYLSLGGGDDPEAAYGTWEWWIKKDAPSGTQVLFISNEPNRTEYDGYEISINGDDKISFYARTDGAVVQTIMTTADGTVREDEWDKFTVARRYDGQFTLRLNDKLVQTVAGSNPATNNTHGTSKYIVFEFDSDDEIAMVSKRFGV